MKRGEMLEFYMKQKGYTVSSLSKKSKVPYTTIRSMIENNLKNSSIDNVIKICRVLGVRVEDLLEETNSNIEYVTKQYLSQRYPYFPIAISAGLPINVEPICSNDVETISIPDSIMGKWAGSKDVYIMRVNGDSMNRIIPHHSLIAVKQAELHELKDGDIVVYSNGGDYAVKKFYRFDDKIIFRPDSHDKSFIDYVVTNDSLEDIKIHGKVVLYIVELD